MCTSVSSIKLVYVVVVALPGDCGEIEHVGEGRGPGTSGCSGFGRSMPHFLLESSSVVTFIAEAAAAMSQVTSVIRKK